MPARRRRQPLADKKVVSFTAFGKYTVTGTLNDQNLVERVETLIDVGFTGDTLVRRNLLRVQRFRRREVSDAHRAASGRLSRFST